MTDTEHPAWIEHMLSDDQLDEFRERGFLVFENFWSEDTCRELRSRMGELVEAFDPAEATSVFSTREQSRTSDDYFMGSGGKIRYFFEEDAFAEDGSLKGSFDQSINKVGHAMHDLDPVFRKHSYSPRVQGILASLFNRPSIVQSMYIFKQPRIGGEVTPHQDGTFLATEPQSCVGLWWSLEDCRKDNGCLWAVPGSHKAGVKRIFRRREDGTGGEFDPAEEVRLEREGAVPVEVGPGALVVLHGAVVHYSAPNTSTTSRHAYSIHTVETQDTNYPERNWLQRPPDTPFRVLDFTQAPGKGQGAQG